MPFCGITTTANMALQSTGQSGRATFLALCRQGVFFLPLILILPDVYKRQQYFIVSGSVIHFKNNSKSSLLSSIFLMQILSLFAITFIIFLHYPFLTLWQQRFILAGASRQSQMEQHTPIKYPSASNGVSNLQRCRAQRTKVRGYLTLAAVAKYPCKMCIRDRGMHTAGP